MFSSCNPKFFAARHIRNPVNPSSDHFHTDAVVPSSDNFRTETVLPPGDHYCTVTVLPSSDHYGTVKVAPPSDHLHTKCTQQRKFIGGKTIYQKFWEAMTPVPPPSGYTTGLITFIYPNNV